MNGEVKTALEYIDNILYEMMVNGVDKWIVNKEQLYVIRKALINMIDLG